MPLLFGFAILGTCCLAIALIGHLTLGIVCFILGLMVWIIRQTRQIGQLNTWVQNPSKENIPHATGIWEDIYDGLARLLRNQAKSQRKLSNTLERFISAAEAMPDGVVILGNDNRIEWCNVNAMHHFGLDRRKDVGQQIGYLVRKPFFTDFIEAPDHSQPLILREHREDSLVLSIQLIPFDSTRKLLISRDITQNERLQTIHKDFIANVSHELRTPLTVMGGFLELLIGPPSQDITTINHYLPMMFEQSQRMRRLVEDLLVLSRLENNAQTQRKQLVDMPNLISELYQDAISLSQEKHDIRLELNSEAKILGDEDELYSALSNLVTNAIRYTPEGGQITLRWQQQQEGRLGKNHCIFSVTDTGIGIEEEHIPRLTERFYRVDKSRSRSTGGTGLGLAIVKHIINHHKGELKIESRYGQGSTFSVLFPATLSVHEQC